jgi:hypothetical protein
MPLTKKGKAIKRKMRETYASKEQADRVFYASINAGKVKGAKKGGSKKGGKKK